MYVYVSVYESASVGGAYIGRFNDFDERNRKVAWKF